MENQKKHENEADTGVMLKIEPEAVVYNDITKHLPQFSGFGLAFRSTMTMMEDEIDEKVHNHCNYACFCYISVSHCCTTCFLVLQVGWFLRALKSINTMAGETVYVMLLPCTLEQLPRVSKKVTDLQLRAQPLFWNNIQPTKQKGE